ncbi:putative Mg2+ transporter-C (MgtC) family protein [Panacagrimonas perspica]|uniref:Protein MgtC n=1 Tax=Panacagrimonas perspica TaxID=381431 RepID=A0A4S3K957_9GAMM|nr:MgtC/SapB family protein [Panacagrimonas perspica]TDU28288.1 putative Mg2+ transporter-C (MgtC) family protein [Panacagrimonas perspica]THD04324.1 hypothetical protein B1810_06060 [Panacagrimonas perspica]
MELSLIEWSDDALRLLAAAFVGALIGLDRELLGKPLGFRTLGVVAIASCALVVAVERYDLALAGDHENVGRAIQGLMAGIGFLGGGVILHTRRDHVKGLTTASLVWLTAALGVVCGLGAWAVAVIGVVLAMLIVKAGGPLERAIERRRAAQKNSEEP